MNYGRSNCLSLKYQRFMPSGCRLHRYRDKNVRFCDHCTSVINTSLTLNNKPIEKNNKPLENNNKPIEKNKKPKEKNNKPIE